MVPAFYLSCLEMITKWENKASTNRSIEAEVHHVLQTLTRDIISRTCFGSRSKECKRIFELVKQVLACEDIQSSYILGWR
ncbi:hypothetical protein LguiB_016681 [Lonicera macranthoides]